jgi:hypothetical protein
MPILIVQDLIENAKPEMAHADFIQIRKGQGDA